MRIGNMDLYATLSTGVASVVSIVMVHDACTVLVKMAPCGHTLTPVVFSSFFALMGRALESRARLTVRLNSPLHHMER